MTKQELFDNFVNTVNGKGQSKQSKGNSTCLYFPKNHPGCAIGCQPGFREKFEALDLDTCKGDTDILTVCNKYPKILDFFSEVGMDFLQQLQAFHDYGDNWDGKFLTEDSIKDFKYRNDLK